MLQINKEMHRREGKNEPRNKLYIRLNGSLKTLQQDLDLHVKTVKRLCILFSKRCNPIGPEG